MDRMRLPKIIFFTVHFRGNLTAGCALPFQHHLWPTHSRRNATAGDRRFSSRSLTFRFDSGILPTVEALLQPAPASVCWQRLKSDFLSVMVTKGFYIPSALFRLLLMGLTLMTAEGVPIKEGEVFPHYVFPRLKDGSAGSLRQFRGRKTILHIFASW